MPINGISNIRRLPRLGIIRLGEKAESAGGRAYPKKLDYFRLDDAPGVADVFGKQPKSLEIMLPHESPDVFFPQWRKAYGRSTGLFCKGDGKTADRTRFGVSDGKPYADGKPNKLSKGTAFDPDGEAYIKEHGLDVKVGARYELPCPGEDCPFTQKKLCRPICQFMFLMPRVPGVGVYQISSTSFNTMVQLNSYIEIIRGIAGRISMIPLKLSLVPKQVSVGGKSIVIYHLKLEYTGLMTDLVKYRNEKYLSADLLPQIEHETPSDLVSRQGADLDDELSGKAAIAGPEEAPAESQIVGPVAFKVASVSKQKTTPVRYKIVSADGPSYFTASEDIAVKCREAMKSLRKVKALLAQKGEDLWIDAVDVEIPEAAAATTSSPEDF